MSWRTAEDFEKDLHYFSENQHSPNDDPEPLPVTIAQWKAVRGDNREQSIYDSIPSEKVVLISSGRGRGRRSELSCPGGPYRHVNSREDDDIKRRLEEIQSWSYSNVNIEATIRMTNGSFNHAQTSMLCEPNQNIVNQTKTNSSSSHNTPSHIKTSRKHNGQLDDEFCDALEQEINVNHLNRKSPLMNDHPPNSNTRPLLMDAMSAKNPVLPLSQMRLNAKREPKQKLYSQVLSSQNKD